MISTKGLELTNFINPDLTWKTVSKGYRSATRRSRKQVDRSPKSDADLPDKGTESPSDTTVSESEKLGVAVLGQRFSDKVEHVPIKKRRFTVRSSSPHHYFSPHKKDHEQFKEDKQSCQKSISKKVDGSTRRRKVFQIYSEDFSGIEILAAAACNNNMGDDIICEDNLLVEESTQDNKDKLNMALPLEECNSLKETSHSSQMDTLLGGAEGAPQNNTDENHHGAEDYQKDATDEKTDEKSVSSRDVRLHWDLNVEMDAWETPCDIDPQTNAVGDGKSEELQILEACEESRDCAGDIAVPVQSIVNQVEERSSCIDKNEDICVPTDDALEYLTSSGLAETSQNVASDAPRNSSSCLLSESDKPSLFRKGTVETSFIDLGVKKVEDDNAIGVQSSTNEKFEEATCKMETALFCESDLKLPQEVASSHSNPPLVPAEEVRVGCAVPGCEVTSASVVPAPEVDINAEEQVVATSMIHPIDVDESAGKPRSNPAELSQNPSVATEDAKGDNHVLNAFEDHLLLEKGGGRDFDTGSDSQYEDGELRESDAPPYWEEVDYEECVDYGSDTCDDAAAVSTLNKFGMLVDCREEEFNGRERSVDKNILAERVFGSGFAGVCEHGPAVDALRQKPVGLKKKPSGSEEFLRGSEISPSRTAEAPDGCIVRNHMNSMDSLDGNDSLAKVFGSGASRKELQGIGESLTTDTLRRNDQALVQRNRSSNLGFCSLSEEARADHTLGKERSDLQIHPKSPAGANPSVNYWDLRRKESPTFRGSFCSDRSRPRSVVESRGGFAVHPEGVGGVASSDSYGPRQTMNSFSSSSYRYPVRRRSPANRDDTHRGILPLRDGSPDRRRFRRYPQGVGRGFREYHQRPLPPNDSDEYPHVSNRIVRRDQNSPPPNRGPFYYRRPYRRSQSRSRSRSPGAWIVSREQHEVAKHRNSRSPEYRFEARVQRMRLPFQKQNFGAKYEVGFISPQRRRFSPQHMNNNNNNSRWFDDQNGGNDYRGRRAPARTFQQGQRFDSVGSSRRLNTDDYYEPAMLPARFSEMGRGRGGGGGARRYEGSDDERRRPDGSRYEMYPRVKRCDSDGLRRIRFHEEDNFVSRNSNNYNDSDNNNSGGERRPRNVYMGELVKRKANQ